MKILRIDFGWDAGIINCKFCRSMNDPSWSHCCECGRVLEDLEGGF